jgi:hypothetical protein
MIKKVMNASDIEKAFNEFYALAIPEKHFKYLYMRPIDKGESEVLILRMKGYASHVAIENIVLKDKTPKRKISTVSIANLTSCPASLAYKLANDDMDNYPASISRWTYSKLAYSLLAYVVSLPYEEKMRVLREADKCYLLEKEASGYSIEQESLVKVDVVSKDDLL